MQWNNQCDWRHLDIVTNPQDSASDHVEFIAWYKQAGKLAFHHELSQFSYQDIDIARSNSLIKPLNSNKTWYYLSATYPERQIRLPGRNDRCICNSGKKFKQCCNK